MQVLVIKNTFPGAFIESSPTVVRHFHFFYFLLIFRIDPLKFIHSDDSKSMNPGLDANRSHVKVLNGNS